MIRLVLVDDQELVRTGLRMLAENDGDIEVVAEAADGGAGLEAVRTHRPDVVLMDLRMPGTGGLTALREVVADPELDGVRVIVLTTFDEDGNVAAAVRAGAAGFLLKDVGPHDLRAAIRIVAAGEAVLSPSVTRRVMAGVGTTARTRPELLTGLTVREVEVLRHVALGESNEEIARALDLSPATSRTYVSRLLGKLSARDRSRLVVLGYESGLVVPGDPSQQNIG